MNQAEAYILAPSGSLCKNHRIALLYLLPTHPNQDHKNCRLNASKRACGVVFVRRYSVKISPKLGAII